MKKPTPVPPPDLLEGLSDVVLDGAHHEDDLPDISGFVQNLPASFIPDGSSYPDWTEDRLYRLADVCEEFSLLYRSREMQEARKQLQVIYDLVMQDGR